MASSPGTLVVGRTNTGLVQVRIDGKNGISASMDMTEPAVRWLIGELAKHLTTEETPPQKTTPA